MKKRRRGVLGVVALASALALWAFVIEQRRLVVHRETIELPQWRPEHAGLRVALISDIHVGSPHWSLDRVRSLVSTTNAEHPDIVLLAGDYMINGVTFGSKVDPEPIAEVLGDLQAPLGVIAVLGNHDWWNDGQRLRHALTVKGIVVLENEVRAIDHAGGRFFVVGLADEMTRPQQVSQTIDEVPTGETSLVLVHEPDVFMTVGSRPSLTMAGHTHGGQVALPFFGRLVVPSAYGQRFAAGHIVEAGRHLFVTTGVGTSIFPVRFGVPPEVALLTLR
jgi:uncharacterized protein